MQGNSGVSGATMRRKLKQARLPAVTDVLALAQSAGSSTATPTIFGNNITASTKVVILPDAALSDELATQTTPAVVTPSSGGALGSVVCDFAFANLPVAGFLFHIFLVGPYGQHVFAGTVSAS